MLQIRIWDWASENSPTFYPKKEYILNLNNRDFVINAPWSSAYSFFFFGGIGHVNLFLVSLKVNKLIRIL